MKLRTRVLSIGASALFASVSAYSAYPDKPIKVVVGFPPGSSGDVIARTLAPRLGEALGQQVIVDNRTGAGGSIAAEGVARAPADGYTLLLSTTANVINQSVPNHLRFDFVRNLAPVLLVAESPVVLVASAASPYGSIATIVTAAKANPGKITFASSGNGTFTHLYGELFNQSAGIKLNHIPYRGSTPALTDILAGQVDLSFTPVAPVLGQIQAGKLKAIAVIGKSRVPSLPDVPTFAEAKLPGFDLPLWFGLHAPAGTPPAVIEKLGQELAKVLETDEVKRPLAAQSILLVGESSTLFAERIARESTQWARVAKTADIKAD